MAIPKIIHQTWKDATIPTQCVSLIQSWKDLHPTWEYKFYTDADNLAFVTSNYPELLTLYNNFEYNIQRVDLVRLLYVRKFGGVYVDIDTMCYKAIDPLVNTENMVLTTLNNSRLHITNSFFAGPANHSYILAVIDAIKIASSISKIKAKYVDETTGAGILTSVAKTNKKLAILPRETFHPIQWHDRNNVTLSTYGSNPKCYGAHIYMSSWL